MTELCFVLAPRQNHFFVEVAEALSAELEQLGVESRIARDGFPPLRDGLVYVLIPPHEYRGLAPPEHWPTPRQLERTIFYCFEQPGTSFFDNDVEMSKGPVGAVLDLNAKSVEEFGRRGVQAHHAPVGWTPAWSHAAVAEDPADDRPERDIDLLHLGIYSARRGEILARSAPLLSRWRTRLVLGDDHGPNPDSQANFAVGSDKWELLSRSRVLLNIHLAERPYFEWLRVVQAICNGTFVVSEHSTAAAPLRAGEHFASAGPNALVLLAERYLDDEGMRTARAADSLAFLRDELPLSATAVTVAELAEEIARRGSASRLDEGAGSSPEAKNPDAVVAWPDNSAWRERPLPGSDDDSSTAWETLAARRGYPPPNGSQSYKHLRPPPGLRSPHPSRSEAADLVHRTTAGRAATPRVSVLTAFAADGPVDTSTLASAISGRGIDVELIAIGGGHAGEPPLALGEWLRAHDDVPALLLRLPEECGPGQARDSAVDFARGELVLVLEPGETLFPHALARLVAALDGSPESAFAWGMAQALAGPGGERPRLLNVFPWQPWRFGAEAAQDVAEGAAAPTGRTTLWRARELRALRSRLPEARRREWDPADLYRIAAEHDMSGTHLPEIVSTSPEGSQGAE